MPFTAEQLHKSASIYFYLLRHKMIDRNQDFLAPYFSEQEIHEATNIIAKQSGTMILETPTKLHLVVEPEGSVYASSFTQLKDKHSRIKNRDELDLLHILLMVLLSEMDGDLLIRNEQEISGVTIHKWIELVDQTMARWDQELQKQPEIEAEWGIAIVQIKDMWFAKQPYEDGGGKPVASTKTKYSYCTLAANLLVEERLLRIIEDDDQTILLPTDELYDRLDLLYHDHDRFKQLKSIIDAGRNQDASH